MSETLMQWEGAFPRSRPGEARARWRASDVTDFQWRRCRELGLRVSDSDTRGEVADRIAAREAELAVERAS